MRLFQSFPRAILTLAAAALLACGAGRDVENTSSECTRCHGGTDNLTGAPPRDVRGNTDPAVRTVGRHTAHVAAGVTCASCHPDRPAVNVAGHLDNKVDVELRGLAVANGAAAAFDAQGATCSNVYCHGSTLNAGGARPALVWTGTLGEPRCGQCHGFPPPAPHPQVSQCSTCHPQTVDAQGAILAGGKHVNGQVDVASVHPAGYGVRANAAFHGPDAIRFLSGQAPTLACNTCHGADFAGGAGPSCNECHQNAGWVNPAWTANCTFCHGTKNVSFSFATNLRQAAPPLGVAEESTGPRVGAHQKHLAGGTTSNGFACATCHAVPTQAAPLAHLDGNAAVVLQGAGQAALPANLGAYTATGQTCATYCHGATLTGGATPTPAWTGAALACSSCHGTPPPTGRHPGNEPAHAFMGQNCGICHADVAGVVPTLVNKALHVNGTADVRLGVGTWDGAAKTCATACHGTLTPFNWQP